MTYFDKICRACLNTTEPFKYFLFDNVSPDLYSFCTSIEVYQNEHLPKTICDNCYDLLAKVFNFKQTCIKSQNTLMGCKNTVKTEKDDVTDHSDDLVIGVNDENGYELDIIKIEANVDKIKNDDYHISNIENAVIEDDVSISNRKRKKKVSTKLQEMSPKHLIVKSVTKLSRRSRMPHIISCKLCKKGFSFLERYEAHKLEHEDKKVSIHCSTCGKTFLTWSGLWRHKERHAYTAPNSFECHACGKTFVTRLSLRRHLYTHRERKLSICDVCGKKFVTAAGLKVHLETHQENRVRRYVCDECGKKFFANGNLRCHISKYHRERKKFKCQLCSLSFTEKNNLKRHLQLHDGLKLFKCEFCEKSFTTKISLVEHKRIHSGERPYSCTYCPKNFPTKKRLNEHHRTHTGEKPYKCGVCNQGFTQRGTMKRHMKVHDKLPTTHG